jgi:cation transport regulator ChaC
MSGRDGTVSYTYSHCSIPRRQKSIILATSSIGYPYLIPVPLDIIVSYFINMASQCLSQQDQQFEKERLYVFGYGSLICAQSRAVSIPALANRHSMPARIYGLVRTWNCRCETPAATFLGVHAIDNNGIANETRKSCVGVLIEVFESDLGALDQREYGYQRQLISLDRVERVDELLPAIEQRNQYNGTFLDTTVMLSRPISTSAQIWAYVPEASFTNPPTAEYPILQSYVDVCMRGCLAISSVFLREFLMSTCGWHPQEIIELHGSRLAISSKKGENKTNDAHSVGSWSNDRHDPIYVRADKVYSAEMASHLDAHMEEALLPVRQIRILV